MDNALRDPKAAGDAVRTATHGVVVHYHEIGLKGRNRGFFERRLVRNLETAIVSEPNEGIETLTGRLVIKTGATAPSEALLDAVGRTFGVASFAPCVVTDAEIDEMVEASLRLLEPCAFETFAIAARRATKDHPLTSREINVELGAAVESATGARVNLSAPDVKVYVEVIGRRSLVYVDRRGGPGGLPVGVSGKVVALLSGGIDSPVSTYRVMRRGAKAVLCHFHSAPFTDGSSTRKAIELARLIAAWQGDTTLYLVPLGEAQRTIVASAAAELRVVLYRRLMFRIATEIARREGAKALVVGDSLGQVASQTLENIACADDACPLPVLRPLVGEDKQDIVSEARRIGTYETSILPFEDCCSLFVPRSPATHARLEDCRNAETLYDVAELVRACLDGATAERIRTQKTT